MEQFKQYLPDFQKVSTIFGVLAELRKLRSHDQWTRDELHAHQDESLAYLRQFAYQQSPFYREFHRGFENAPLSELPVLTKAMMMDNFDDFVTDRSVHLNDVRSHIQAGSVGRFNRIYEVATTSGSTGNPGIFMFDPNEWKSVMASFAKAREWAGQKVNIAKRSKMAVVSSTNERNLSARVGKAADTPFIPTLRVDSTEDISEITRELTSWNPHVLVAYASMANILAAQQLQGALNIHPDTIFTSSEVLTPQMRKNIEKVWGEIVFNEYASTETATIAAEDMGHHGMHLFEDLLIVENVDEHNKPVSDGKYGDKLLVTTLFSRTQPLIRYEISDSVRFATEQPRCKLPYKVIDGVQGRKEDILDIQGIQLQPNVFHDVMDTIPNKGWQIIQEKNGIKILLVDPQATSDSVIEQLKAVLQQKGIENLPITISEVDQIPKAKSGKAPLIKAFKS